MATAATQHPTRQNIDLAEALKNVFKMYSPIIGISLGLILKKLEELPSPYQDLCFSREELDAAFDKLFQKQSDGFQIGIRVGNARYSCNGTYAKRHWLEFDIEHPKHYISFYWRQNI